MRKAVAERMKNLVRANYDTIAADFDKSRKKAAWPELARLAAKVQAGQKVLDAGCGNGRLLELLESREIEYTGFDLSEKLIVLARCNYPARDFRVSDISADIPGKDYDYIFCIAVLPHLPGRALREASLRNLLGALKPGGLLVASAWNMRRQEKFRRLLRRAWWRALFFRNELESGDLVFNWKNAQGLEVSPRYYHAFSFREWKKMAAESGAHIESVYQDDFNFWLILKK